MTLSRLQDIDVSCACVDDSKARRLSSWLFRQCQIDNTHPSTHLPRSKLQIQELETFVVANPPPHYGGRYFIFVKLTTDNGIIGIGEVYTATFAPHVVEAMVRDVFEHHMIGSDPFHIERLWRRVYGRGYTLRPDVSLMSVLSGLETACWDIVGKAVEKPVYELLGGRVHERLRTYTYIYPRVGEDDSVYSDPELAAERALEYVAMGFTALKFDPAGGYSVFDGRQPSLEALDRCELFVKTLRKAVGNRADLLFGTHGQFTAAGAIRLAKRLESSDPLWFEEPTPPENPKEMARVARQTCIPIATGERLTTKYEFARVLEEQAASIVQMALGRVGGLLEAKKIASMAETYYAQIAPHLYCGPVEGAANVQLATCTPNFLILESIEDWGGFHSTILKSPVRWEAGYVIPPTTPGIGVELDEGVARAHPYAGDKLHLEMQEDPIV
ncbi:MAG: mandelate racemase/muconate lactonizing enzyme family protein [Granulosicoccus sp.]